MRMYAFALRLLAPAFLLVAALHLALGVGADALLGAHVPADALSDATLNSQNRFYGVCFALYGVLLLIAAGDVPRYQQVIKATFWVFLAGGVSRVLSVILEGPPSAWVIALGAVELVLPVIMLFWLFRLCGDQASRVAQSRG